MKYRLLYSPEAFENIKKLPTKSLKAVEKTLLKISENPFLGKKLLGKLTGLHSIRIGKKYRLLYQVNKKITSIFVIDIGHRKDIYR